MLKKWFEHWRYVRRTRRLISYVIKEGAAAMNAKDEWLFAYYYCGLDTLIENRNQEFKRYHGISNRAILSKGKGQ